MRHSTTMSRGEFAKFCDVSPATVTNWMDAGMPATRTGRRGGEVLIDPAVAIPWVINHREPPGSQRERLAGEQADKVALQNAQKRGELVLVEQIAEVFSALAAELAARFDAVPGRVANEFAGISDAAVIRQRLLDELREVRGAVADAVTKLAESLGAAEDDGPDSEAPAEEERKPVGGSDEAPAGRKRRALVSRRRARAGIVHAAHERADRAEQWRRG